jgi:hypothetical protein
MRLIFVIITFLGAVTFGYGLVAAWHFQNGMADVNQTLFSKTEAVVTYDDFKKIAPLLDKLKEQHTRDSFIIIGLGGCISVLGFTGLIIERKRNVPHNAA